MPRLASAMYEGLLDFVVRASESESVRPFPEELIAALRDVIRCEAVAYREWSREQACFERSVSADDLEERISIWQQYYPFHRGDDPLPTGRPTDPSDQDPLPSVDLVGRPIQMSDVVTHRQFRRTGLYFEICRPFAVRSVLKLYLPNLNSVGAAFVFDTSRSRFTANELFALQLLVPHLIQIRRRARELRLRPLADSRIGLLSPREWVVLGHVAAGETNREIASALFIGPTTVRKHLEHIYEKLEVRNRTAATVAYLQARRF